MNLNHGSPGGAGIRAGVVLLIERLAGKDAGVPRWPTLKRNQL